MAAHVNIHHEHHFRDEVTTTLTAVGRSCPVQGHNIRLDLQLHPLNQTSSPSLLQRSCLRASGLVTVPSSSGMFGLRSPPQADLPERWSPRGHGRLITAGLYFLLSETCCPPVLRFPSEPRERAGVIKEFREDQSQSARQRRPAETPEHPVIFTRRL